MKAFLITLLLVVTMAVGACQAVTPAPAVMPEPAATSAPESVVEEAAAMDLAEAPEGVQSAVTLYADETDTDLSTISLLAWEEVEWPDSCLGAAGDEMCAMVITPGYRISLDAGGQKQTIHTDASGSYYRVPDSGHALTACATRG